MENLHILKNNISNLRKTVNSKFLKFYDIQDSYPESTFNNDVLRKEISFIKDVKDNKEICVLYLDDDENTLNIFNLIFKNDFIIFLASSTEKAIEILNTEKIDILITDNLMPNISGLEFIYNIKNMFDVLPVFFLTSSSIDQATLDDAKNAKNIFKVLEKPFNVKDVKQYVSDAYNQYKR